MNVQETCGCGAEWWGPDSRASDRADFRAAHAVCRGVVTTKSEAIPGAPLFTEEEVRDAVRVALNGSPLDGADRAELAANVVICLEKAHS